MLILWGARTCAFGAKNCRHFSKRVISSLSDHKIIAYRCREQRVFRSLNVTRSIWILAYLSRDDKVWRFHRFVSSIYSV